MSDMSNCKFFFMKFKVNPSIYIYFCRAVKNI